jgi:hypothetical protein
MARPKKNETLVVEPVIDPVYPEKVTIESDCTYWIQTCTGADITRQWYAGQVIRDPEDIRELMANNAPLKD